MSADVVAELEGTVDELRALIEGMSPADLRRTPPDGWSAEQVLAHLADFELIAGVRARTLLTVERPALVAYGQAEFTRRFSGLETAEALLARFAVNRLATVRVLRTLDEQDWERAGVHPVRGDETLRQAAAYLLRHDREHLQQIRAAAAG
jgi:DinB superfamily